TRWQLQSASPARFQETLPPRQRQRALALPLRLNPRTVALGAQWRQEAGTDDAAIVQRALNWVRTEFTYTLAATERPGLHTVDEFLFRDKAGFCEQFSSSFVVLMRASGIPARVVTGYVGGIYNNLGHYWVIRRMDAHAWAEVWLPQRGWVRVDPTAAVAPERIRDTLEDRLAQNNNDASIDGHWRLADIGDWLRHSWNNLVLGFDAKRQQQLLHSFGIDHLHVSQLMMLFIAFTSVSLGLMAWWLARGEGERDALLRAWHRLDRHYARLGLGRKRHEPALVWAKRIEQQYPGIGLYILSQRFTNARYSSKDFDRNLINALLQHRPHTAVSNIENTFTCSIHRSLDVGCLHDRAKTTSRTIQRNHTK
ncbi:MAG TPA: transglutaminase-like domain-containing protein, partial [Xylella fastidiosa subsp. pauca]